MTTVAAYAVELPTLKDAAAQTEVVPPASAGESANSAIFCEPMNSDETEPNDCGDNQENANRSQYERCPPGASEEPPNQTTRPAGSAHRNFRLDRFFSKQPCNRTRSSREA